MSNELEALLIIGVDYGISEDNQCAVINLHYNGIDHIIYETHDKEQVIALDEIARMENKKQTALTEYEAIKNTNPSEALECLEDIYRNGVFISDYDALGKQHPTNISPKTNKSFDEQCKTIKQSLLKAQEQEKVLEIIVKKNVDIEYIKTCFYDEKGGLKEYNAWVGHDEDKELTEEEFITLKENLL